MMYCRSLAFLPLIIRVNKHSLYVNISTVCPHGVYPVLPNHLDQAVEVCSDRYAACDSHELVRASAVVAAKLG